VTDCKVERSVLTVINEYVMLCYVNVYIGKMIIKAAKKIFNNDKN